MTPLEQEIEKLSKIWYYFVSTDHHKDRDCHWTIEQRFSYGGKPYFQAYHYGYIASTFEGSRCNTLQEAQEELRDRLALEIHKAKEWVGRNLEDAKKQDAETLFGGSAEEYELMLHYLNGGEYLTKQ